MQFIASKCVHVKAQFMKSLVYIWFLSCHVNTLERVLFLTNVIQSSLYKNVFSVLLNLD